MDIVECYVDVDFWVDIFQCGNVENYADLAFSADVEFCVGVEFCVYFTAEPGRKNQFRKTIVEDHEKLTPLEDLPPYWKRVSFLFCPAIL